MRLPLTARLTAPFQSKQAFVEALKAPRQPGEHIAVGSAKWSNKE